MLFDSLIFVVFYVVVTALYFLLPHKYRWILLLIASSYFYMAFVPVYILLLIGVIAIGYLAGIAIERSEGKRRKNILTISVIANVLILCMFKYYNFINDNLSLLLQNFHYQNPVPYLKIILPLGLSFYIFQAISYLVEVYRRNTPAERHLGIYSLYVMFYPKLVAGPIERPQNLLPQFRVEHKFEYTNMVYGLRLMLWGFFKKLVVADRLAIYVASVFGHPSTHNGTTIVIASLFFAIQIYCDFSSYTDIAIGCARTMGFKLMNNFKRPYFSKSIKEFWSRWHISLSTWFRDYLYIPLGGNRVAVPRMYLNILIVFTVSGIWHGASYNFVIWGFIHGVFLIMANVSEKLKQKLGISYELPSFIKIITTIILVTIAWIFFRANTLDDAVTMLSGLKTFGRAPFTGGINNMAHCIFAIFILAVVEIKAEYFSDKYNWLSRNLWIKYAAMVALVLVIMMFGVFSGGQFIYFQF